MTRRRVIESVEDVPAHLINEIIEAMAERMSGTPEARRTGGLSFAFHMQDRRIQPACYRVGPRGVVTLERGAVDTADFVFRATAADFDLLLLGRSSPMVALVRRRVSMTGSLSHIRELLRMMHVVEAAYTEARIEIIERHSHRYDFRI